MLGGDIAQSKAYSLAVQFADGTQLPVRFYFVSKPIAAGFFFASIPKGHETVRTRAVAAVLRDRGGRVLARQQFTYQTPAQLARQRARTKALLKRLEHSRHHRPSFIPSPPLPAPTPPFQRAEAEGISVVAGRNGVVMFDTSRATPAVRLLISGRPVAYGCFKRLPYDAGPIDLTFPRSTAARVAIRLQGVMAPPLMGCDVQGTYGHLWPDRDHGHSAAEIAFTPAARDFFQDRAAARDLALFLRSKSMHATRRLAGDALARRIQRQYGTKIVRLDSPGASPPHDRIGYATTGETTTFVEQSTTGRRFFVHVAHGRIRGQNLRPFALVF